MNNKTILILLVALSASLTLQAATFDNLNIIGLNQIQKFEQKALENELNNKLKEVSERKKKSLNLLLIEYHKSLLDLAGKYSKLRINLVKQKGSQDEYAPLRRELNKAYESHTLFESFFSLLLSPTDKISNSKTMFRLISSVSSS